MWVIILLCGFVMAIVVVAVVVIFTGREDVEIYAIDFCFGINGVRGYVCNHDGPPEDGVRVIFTLSQPNAHLEYEIGEIFSDGAILMRRLNVDPNQIILSTVSQYIFCIEADARYRYLDFRVVFPDRGEGVTSPWYADDLHLAVYR